MTHRDSRRTTKTRNFTERLKALIEIDDLRFSKMLDLSRVMEQFQMVTIS